MKTILCFSPNYALESLLRDNATAKYAGIEEGKASMGVGNHRDSTNGDTKNNLEAANEFQHSGQKV